MIPSYKTKKVLIVVKTYPTPSSKYKETVCTAGITSEGEWIRLYPVKFRQLSKEKQYSIFNWVEASVKKNDKDFRPESYTVDNDSIKILGHLDSKKDIQKRCDMLLPLVKQSLEDINREYEEHRKSLAIFQPKSVEEFIIENDTADWTPEEISKLSQKSFFDIDDLKLLKKVPYQFSCKFHCNDSKCKGHKIVIKEWEFNWAYFSYLSRYDNEKVVLEKLKEKWLSYFSSDKNGYLMMGTILPYPHFIIIGHFSYPKKYYSGSQISFLNNSELY